VDFEGESSIIRDSAGYKRCCRSSDYMHRDNLNVLKKDKRVTK
jgi:hypothetical protein